MGRGIIGAGLRLHPVVLPNFTELTEGFKGGLIYTENVFDFNFTFQTPRFQFDDLSKIPSLII